MNKFKILQEILQGSKEYKFEYGENGMTILVLINYRTGERVKLDLAKMDEEIFEILQPEETEEEEW